MTICRHCTHVTQRHRRGLCWRCYRLHRDEYPSLRLGAPGPLVCVCSEPDVGPVGGIWATLGAVVCNTCQRPPSRVLS